MAVARRSLSFSLIALAGLAGCESYNGDDLTGSASAARLAAAPAVASTQRLDSSGFPLLGAYPTAASAQFQDAEVQALDRDLNAAAAQRGQPVPTNFDARVARAADLRSRQAANVAALDAGNAASTGAARATPEEVLRQIESGQ